MFVYSINIHLDYVNYKGYFCIMEVRVMSWTWSSEKVNMRMKHMQGRPFCLVNWSSSSKPEMKLTFSVILCLIGVESEKILQKCSNLAR